MRHIQSVRHFIMFGTECQKLSWIQSFPQTFCLRRNKTLHWLMKLSRIWFAAPFSGEYWLVTWTDTSETVNKSWYLTSILIAWRGNMLANTFIKGQKVLASVLYPLLRSFPSSRRVFYSSFMSGGMGKLSSRSSSSVHQTNLWHDVVALSAHEGRRSGPTSLWSVEKAKKNIVQEFQNLSLVE